MTPIRVGTHVSPPPDCRVLPYSPKRHQNTLVLEPQFREPPFAASIIPLFEIFGPLAIPDIASGSRSSNFVFFGSNWFRLFPIAT